jgi:hypothetical protein
MMRRVELLLVVVVLCLTLGTSESPPAVVAVETGLVPIGTLGHPLGELVTLEGTRANGSKSGVRTLQVEKIDGNALASPVSIGIDNIDLPEGQRCVIRGYETMRMVGMAPAYDELARLKNEPLPMKPQAGWQVRCSFVALEVVEPDSLEIKEPGTQPSP